MAAAFLLLLFVCSGATEDTGLGFDQPGIDDPTARRWSRAGSWYALDPDELEAELPGYLAAVGSDSPAPAKVVLTPHARPEPTT